MTAKVKMLIQSSNGALSAAAFLDVNCFDWAFLVVDFFLFFAFFGGVAARVKSAKLSSKHCMKKSISGSVRRQDVTLNAMSPL